jgi:hypothetical protein
MSKPAAAIVGIGLAFVIIVTAISAWGYVEVSAGIGLMAWAVRSFIALAVADELENQRRN